MTVNTTNITSGPYSGNDIADEFSYTFRVETKNQLVVYEDDVALTVDTDYTVAGIGDDAGGVITRVAGPLPTGSTLYIRSDYKYTQDESIRSQGAFFPEIHEDAFDKLTFLIQQLLDGIDRSFKLPDSYSGGASAELPTPESLKFVRWNSAANALENTFGTTSAVASDVTTDTADLQTVLDSLSYSTLAEMDADTDLVVGMKVRTLGSLAANDGGGNDYLIVSAGTGTDDGGSFIDLSGSGLQAKGLFPGKDIKAMQFGATGDGSTDDILKLRNAVAYAESLCDALGSADVGDAHIELDLQGNLYAVTDTLEINRAIKLKNGALVATAAPTTTDFMIKINPAGRRATIESVDLDGGLSGTTRYADLIHCDAERVTLQNFIGIHFPNYGLRMTSGTQEAQATNLVLREWQFDEAGTADGTLRTANALSVEDADCKFTNVVCAQSLYPLYTNGALNVYTGCHFYNGGSTTTTEDVSAYIDATDNNMFVGCYFDNGRVYIKDSFNHNFSGCHFQLTAAGTNTSAIFTYTSAADEKVVGLCVTGGTFNGTYSSGELAFGGPGTYADNNLKLISWAGNTNADGTEAWVGAKLLDSALFVPGFQTVQASGTDYTIRGNKNLRLHADYNANSGASESKIIWSTDGTDWWNVGSTGAILPEADNSRAIGSSAFRLNNAFTNRLTLIDGVSAPSAIAGHAQIFVDTADGDLKVKFGDGVTKTIVVDT